MNGEEVGCQKSEVGKVIRYCCAFMFSPNRESVALIRKRKPAWQHNKLNGIGGKVEEGEDAATAMVRKFQEETGMQTERGQWAWFMEMSGQNDGGTGAFKVDFFTTTGDLYALKTMEEEPIEIIRCREVYATRGDMIENLPWLIPLALDFLHDGRPGHVSAIYP